MSEAITAALDAAEADAARRSSLFRPAQSHAAADKPLTVGRARMRLHNTRGMSEEQVEHAARVVRQFQQSRPARPCPACHCGTFEEKIRADTEAEWRCGGCGRLPMSVDEWNKVQWDARQAAEEAARNLLPEPVTDPRDDLVGAKVKRKAAIEALDKLTTAINVAREAATTATEALAAAESGAGDQRERTIAQRVTALLAGKPAPAVNVVSDRTLLGARAEADAAVSALERLKGDLPEAEQEVASAQASVQRLALRCLALERVEALIQVGTEAQTTMLSTVRQLEWFKSRAGGLPLPGMRFLEDLEHGAKWWRAPAGDVPDFSAQLAALIEKP